MPQLPFDKVFADLDSRCEAVDTPCGDGAMRWRCIGTGEPLVLLHGAFGSWLHWFRNIEELSRNHRLLIADMPGYGASAMPPEPFTAQSLAAIMADGVRRMLGDSPFDIAGFSMGGIIGGSMAALLGEQVRALIVIGPNGMGLPFPPMPTLRRPEPGLGEDELAELTRYNLGQLMLADPDAIDDLAVAIHLENARLTRASSSGIPAGDDLLQALPRIRARVGAIYGTADAYSAAYLDAREATLRRFQPDLDFRRIEGAGHWVIYERAATINDAIEEMLAAG